eukprot:1180669-Prorocentrum_minimum.AAC.1
MLMQIPGVTDYNNALKLGYDPDPKVEAFPAWMLTKVHSPPIHRGRLVLPVATSFVECLTSFVEGLTSFVEGLPSFVEGVTSFVEGHPAQELAPVLPPKVVAPGEVVGKLAPAVAKELGLPGGAVVCGGTTDSIAAFLAAGVSRPGQVRRRHFCNARVTFV